MIERLTQYSEDIRWGCNMVRARLWRRDCTPEQRAKFDAVFRPLVSEVPVTFPDAIYRAGPADLLRAMGASGWPFYRPRRDIRDIR